MESNDRFQNLSLNDDGVNVVFHNGLTPLMHAILDGDNERSLRLIASGADVNISDNHGKTALMLAAEHDNKDIAKLLIENGAGVNVSDKCGQTVLMFAAKHNNKEIAKLLIEYGAGVNASDNIGQTSLMYAAEHNNEEVAKLLIEEGANVNVSTIEGGSALFMAALNNSEEVVVLLLLNSGIDVNSVDKQGQTALFAAVKRDNNDNPELLLDGTESMEVESDQRNSCRKQNITRALAQACNDVNGKDSKGKTALFYAIDQNKEPLVRILVDAGADVDIKDNNGQTPLFCAVECSTASMVSFLIAAGADVNSRDSNHETVLFNAVRYNNTEVIELLVDRHNADVNTRNGFGRTPMFYAITSEFAIQTARLLLDKGAKLNDTDNCDFSVLSFYTEHRCNNDFTDNEVEILEIFTENGIQMDRVFTSTINIMYSKLPSFVNKMSQRRSQIFVSKAITLIKNYAHNDVHKRLIETLEMHLTGEHLDDKLLDLLDVLFQLGANPNSVDTDGNTALHYTFQPPFFGISDELTMDVVLKLENNRARFDIQNHQGQTPLMFCLSSLDCDKTDLLEFNTVKAICGYFLKRAPPIGQGPTRNGESVFHVLMRLFQNVLFIDERQKREKVLYEMSELLKLFCPPYIVEGVTVNTPDNELKCPLHLWASLYLGSNHDDVKSISRELAFENLLKTVLNHLRICGVKLNTTDAEDQSPLHHSRTWIAFKCLVDAGAKRNYQDSRGRTPVLAAAHNKVFMKNAGHFFPDVTDDPKSFFTRCVKLDLDLWACDNEGESVLSLLLASQTFVLAEALVEVACESKSFVLELLLTVICRDTSTHTFWKSHLVQKILTCRDKPQMDLNSALQKCCLNIKRLHEKEGRENEDGPPTKKARYDYSSGCREDMSDPLPSSVHLEIARQLLLHGADGESCRDLCADFHQLHTFLTEEIDLSQIPVSIPWTSYSTMHEAKLGSVARQHNFEQIGTYWFHQEPIGSGSFGHIFAGINEKDGREIAIKKIEKLRMVRPEDTREIRNLSVLAECPQVVSYIFFDDSEKHFVYIGLELMEGHLDEYFASSFFHPRQHVSLCKDVVMGLKYLHDRRPTPILHRDLKPGNILYKVHPKICLKIADFGLSSPLTTTGTTVLGTNVGTRCWIAPEVMNSGTYQHSMASDNYSCGLLLHYILSFQKHPFSPADCSNNTREVIDLKTQYNMLNNTMDGWEEKLSPEATHLIKALLTSNVAERPSALDSLSHPLFWSNKKKMTLLTAVGNQPEMVRPCPAFGPLGAVESNLEAKFSRIVQRPTWVDASYSYMPSLYVEMSRRRPYNTRSVVGLVRFIRNTSAHSSCDPRRPRNFAKQIHEDAVFLVEFPHLVIEVFKVVIKHGWETREEIKEAMSSEYR